MCLTYRADPDEDDEHFGLPLGQMSFHGKHDAKEPVTCDQGQGQDTGHQGEH